MCLFLRAKLGPVVLLEEMHMDKETLHIIQCLLSIICEVHSVEIHAIGNN